MCVYNFFSKNGWKFRRSLKVFFIQVNKVVWDLPTVFSAWSVLCLETFTGNNIRTGKSYIKAFSWTKLCRYLAFHGFLALLLTQKQLGWRTREKATNNFHIISPLGANFNIILTGLHILESTLTWPLLHTNSRAVPPLGPRCHHKLSALWPG